MDIKIQNKVAEILRFLEDEEQHLSLSDPVAKMMLVAQAYLASGLESKMDQTVTRLAEHFGNKVLSGDSIRALPALAVAAVGNGNENMPFYLDSSDSFLHKASKCRFRPIFRSRIVPGKLVACFVSGKLLSPGRNPVKADRPDTRHANEMVLAYDAFGEINTLEDAVIAFSHPLPSGRLTAEIGDEQISLSMLMDETPHVLNTNFMLAEFWKKSLVHYGVWLYRFGKCNGKRVFQRRETPSWIKASYRQSVLEPFLGKNLLWIRIKSGKGISLPSDTAILMNAIPIVNYDIRDVKLSYSEPVKCLENDKTGSYFLDVAQNGELAHEFFIRDFDVSQYDSERIREDINNLYQHYVNDYYAFVDSSSLHDGAILRSLRQAMMQVYDSLTDYRPGNQHPYEGAYAIRNPRNNRQPVVLTYYVTDGERGNMLKQGETLTSSNAAAGRIQALTDATGGRNKIKGMNTRKELAKHFVNSNDRLFTEIDLLQYCKAEFMRAFGEDAIGYCNISLSESSVPVDKHIEKCLDIQFEISSDSLKNTVEGSDFLNSLHINIDLRKSFAWPVNLRIV